MLLPILTTLFLQFQGLSAQAVDANGITLEEKKEALERQMLDPFTLVSLVNPCNINFGADPNEGEQTSAEWVRIVFHDMITANIEGPGLGGLDASISFESDRPENIGVFVNVTIGQFSQFSSVFLSMADLIGVGLSDSLATCDLSARRIPLRVGRIDATHAGPAGVPEPTTSVQDTIDTFALAGLNQTEMIQAIACGHSLGGVHHTNFPDIVPDLQDPTNLHGRSTFDSTPAVFDNTGITEYLAGTGLKGGPLVVGPDETNSDLRLFSSDGNDTITAMSTPQSFQDTCFNIFEKMLNTVPSAVTLSEPFLPRPWLLRFSKLDIDENGDVTFEGKITGHSSNPLPNTASYTYEKSTGGNTGTKTSDPGAVFPVPIGFGTIADFDFKDVLGDSDITSINIQGTYTSTINQKLFILPSQSFSNPESGNGGGIVRQKFILRAAVLSSLAPAGTVLTARIWYPQTQPNSVAPRIDSVTDVMTFKSTLGVYSIYHVVLEFGDGENFVANGAPVGHITLGNIQSSAKIELNNLHLTPCTEADLADC